MKHDEIVHALMETTPSLVEVERSPLSRHVTLRFRGESEEAPRHTMTLRGVHLWAARSSLLGPAIRPPSEDAWEDWTVNWLEIGTNSKFFKRFMKHKLGLDSRVYLYDSSGTKQSSRRFLRPVHLAMSCGSGVLDIICETIELSETTAAARPSG